MAHHVEGQVQIDPGFCTRRCHKRRRCCCKQAVYGRKYLGLSLFDMSAIVLDFAVLSRAACGILQVLHLTLCHAEHW